MSTLTGRTIVITGGSGALGRAVVHELAQRGADCRVPLMSGDLGEGLSGLDGNISTRADVDLRNESSVKSFYADLPELWGSVHLAGGFAMAPISETTLEQIETMHQMNFVTAFLCCREALARMNGGGRIVNVAARPALSPCGGMSAYLASKAAVAAFTQGLADETRAQGVTVNAIVPSIIDTPSNREAMPDADHGAWPSPTQLAKTIAFLLSEDAGITSGVLVPVYGRA